MRPLGLAFVHTCIRRQAGRQAMADRSHCTIRCMIIARTAQPGKKVRGSAWLGLMSETDEASCTMSRLALSRSDSKERGQ